MTTGVDVRSIAVDLNRHPTDRTQFDSRDYSELLRKLAGINGLSITCSIFCIVIDLIFTLISLGMGGSNQKLCPIENRIPIYLIVFGCVNLISLCFSVFGCLMHNRGQDQTIGGFYAVACSAVMIILFQFFNFIWLIVGSVWIFGVFNNVQYTDSGQSSTYCKGALYQYAVVTVILQYVFPLVLCCCKNIPFYF